MKISIFIAVMALFAITSGVFVPPRHGQKKIHLLGSDHCTWGPTHWCRNLTNAAQCHATKHCIDTVWTHMTLPPDSSTVCQICLDMVKQARDQLESNETQELIKEVFEGTCALIHIKPIVVECDKIADDYIPDLIETLASEMNPQVVCSVAGLCNNDIVDRWLKEQPNTDTTVGPVKRDICQDCHTVVGLAEEKFSKLTRDEVLESLLTFCGKMGSFSDGCSNIVVTYFQEIYTHLQDHFNPNEICLMSGECSAKFHTHNTAKVEITPMSHVGYVPVDADKEKEDLPCELCEQLVSHLKDLLIANTTEEEFDKVLEGLCKQTGKFSTECLDLVQQYYSEIYQYLVKELDSNEVCTMIGICHPSSNKESPIAPLLPPKTANLALSLSQHEEKPLVHIKLQSDKATMFPPLLLPPGLQEQQQQPQQLPIDLLMPPHTQVLYSKQVCLFCEYFLHYVQEGITEPKTEDKIKEIIDKACEQLPQSLNDTCTDFVNTYEPALIALLAQELDPSQICPLIKACPSTNNKDVEIFMEAKGDSKCPLCLFAVTKLESMVKDKKTQENIKEALGKLCSHLPENMKNECDDFVHTYTDELVDMLIADLKPEEVCVYLKLCTDERPPKNLPPYVKKPVSGDTETNAIEDNTINGKVNANDISSSSVEESPQCVLCEFVMKEIEDQLADKTTDNEIENIVRNICNVMPSSVKKQCNDFVTQYGDAVIQLLIETLKPNDICPMLKLCNNQSIETMHVEILECPICQLTVEAMEKILANPKIDHDVEHVLEKTCRGVPVQYRDKCVEIIEKYGDSMIDMLIHYTDKDFVCQKIGYCKSTLHEIIID